MSQYMPPNNGVYTLRPSISTSSLFDKLALNPALKPRAEIALVVELTCATSRFGARRRISGIVVAPELMICWCVMT